MTGSASCDAALQTAEVGWVSARKLITVPDSETTVTDGCCARVRYKDLLHHRVWCRVWCRACVFCACTRPAAVPRAQLTSLVPMWSHVVCAGTEMGSGPFLHYTLCVLIDRLFYSQTGTLDIVNIVNSQEVTINTNMCMPYKAFSHLHNESGVITSNYD